MSAFIVSPEHIRELAAFAASRSSYSSFNVNPLYLHHPNGIEDRKELGSSPPNDDLATYYANILYQENIRSVSHRYPGESLNNLPGLIEKPESISVSFAEVAFRKVRNPVHILKMCDSLEYQSCETDDWDQSYAYEILDSIRRAAIRQLPGYDESPWEYFDAA